MKGSLNRGQAGRVESEQRYITNRPLETSRESKEEREGESEQRT